jgi:hypothetical protein
MFVLERETKGAALYKEVDAAGAERQMYDPECVVGSLYVRKQFFNGRTPTQRIGVTVEAI